MSGQEAREAADKLRTLWSYIESGHMLTNDESKWLLVREAALAARVAELEQALRDARPYVYGVQFDPANAGWRMQTATTTLERVDAALAASPAEKQEGGET